MTRNSFSHLKNQAIGTGYLRKDGRIGIRNRLLILYTSPCAEFAARKISQAFSPNTVEVLGFTRNCTSSFTEMKLKKYLTHPNIGGALIVSHSSEGLDSSNLLKEALLSGRCAALLSLDHNRGIANSINQGLLLVKDLLASLSVNPSQPLRFSDLIIALISFCTIRKCCCISVSVTSGSTLYEATNSFNISHLRRVCASSCPMNSSLNKFILSPVLLNKNHQKIRWLEDQNYNTV